MIRYIPFLKAKCGELTAMGELAPNVKHAICPFFDFPRKKPEYDVASYMETTRNVAARLKKHWGSEAEFYFDDFDIAQTLKVDGRHQYAYVLGELKELKVIPVVALDRTEHNNAVMRLKKDNDISSNTVAFRAEQSAFEDFDTTEDHIDYDMAAIFKEFATIDLILDCRFCSEMNAIKTAQQIAPFVHKFCVTYDKVRRVIVTGSSIPATMREAVPVNSAATIKRHELDIIAKARTFSDSELVAGDYATVSPFYSDAVFEPWLFEKVTAPKLIYSFNHSHYIARGTSLKTGGRDQYYGLIAELWKKDFVRPENSAGEKYFYDKINRVGKSATNGTVVKPSIVAHISYMALTSKV